MPYELTEISQICSNLGLEESNAKSMDESESFLSSPALPPRRKLAFGSNTDSAQQSVSDEILAKNEEIAIDPELLADFEKAVKEVGNEVTIDLDHLSQDSRITAPIVEDYVDPHTVPIRYLLEQARTRAKSDQTLPNSVDTNDDTSEKDK